MWKFPRVYRLDISMINFYETIGMRYLHLFQNCTQCRRQWIIQRLGCYCRIVIFFFFFSRRPTYRYSQLSQEDEDLEGSETFKYNPKPKGLRAYRDYDTSDDVRFILTYLVSRILSVPPTDNRRVRTLGTNFPLKYHFKIVRLVRQF